MVCTYGNLRPGHADHDSEEDEEGVPSYRPPFVGGRLVPRANLVGWVMLGGCAQVRFATTTILHGDDFIDGGGVLVRGRGPRIVIHEGGEQAPQGKDRAAAKRHRRWLRLRPILAASIVVHARGWHHPSLRQLGPLAAWDRLASLP